MAVFKRPNSEYYWYKFMFGGQLYQQSAKVKNKRQAEIIEAAYRTQLAKGEVSLEDRKPAPPLREFAQRFIDFVQVRHEAKPQTIQFYANRLKRLLEWEPFRNARLDKIDESLIQKYVVQRRKKVQVVAVNRELATLRRILHLAKEWKEIQSVPKVRLLPGEKNRDFVLTPDMEREYLAACPPVLREVAILMLNTGLRLGEALALKWQDVIFDPIGKSKYGLLQIRDGKSVNAKRAVPLTSEAESLLKAKKEQSNSVWVFPADAVDRPLIGTSLDHTHAKVRRPTIDGKQVERFPKVFVLHSLRHTFLTHLGEAGADAFTIMRIAGHSSITVSQRYVHPTGETVERAFDRLQALKQPALKAPETS